MSIVVVVGVDTIIEVVGAGAHAAHSIVFSFAAITIDVAGNTTVAANARVDGRAATTTSTSGDRTTIEMSLIVSARENAATIVLVASVVASVVITIAAACALPSFTPTRVVATMMSITVVAKNVAALASHAVA